MAPNKRAMTVSNLESGFVDKRRATSASQDGSTHNLQKSVAAFTANGAGTTTTIVGANAAPGTNDNNILRRGEKIQLFTSGGVKKEETVFTITNIAVAGSTTATFTPAAAVATANGDIARVVGNGDMEDIDDLMTRMSTLTATDAQINQMTLNDMIYAVRVADNPDGI